MFAIKIKKSVFNRNILMWVLIIAVTAAFGVGVVESGSVAIAEDAAADNQQGLSNEPVQSINFEKDWSVREALQFLAAEYHKNIVPSPEVAGTVTVVQLYDVTFAEAMSAVLGNQFKAVAKGNFINVYTIEEYTEIKEDKSRLTSRVFTLYYVNAAEVKALIEPVISENGRISTTTAAATDTTAGAGGDTLSMRDMIMVYDYPERIEKIAEMIKQIDVRPPQILIEVTILQAKLNETTQFGINWNSINGMAVTAATSGLSFATSTALSASQGLTVGIPHGNIQALITASEDVTDTTVLANPKIMALNKQAGYINIGEERGYNKSVTDNASGTQTTSVEFLESGTILKFRPFICDNGYIRMEINPEESTASLQSNNIPLKTITQVKTNIMVKDGKTIIIGGLFKEDLTNTNTQVPVAGDLPIIGSLFKRTKDANIRTELVILITPHIINEPEDTMADERVEDIDRIVHGSRKRISSATRARIYEDGYNKAVELYSNGEYEKALAELDWIIAFRPNALEAVQLKERILKQTNAEATERDLLNTIDVNDSRKWRRR